MFFSKKEKNIYTDTEVTQDQNHLHLFIKMHCKCSQYRMTWHDKETNKQRKKKFSSKDNIEKSTTKKVRSRHNRNRSNRLKKKKKKQKGKRGTERNLSSIHGQTINSMGALANRRGKLRYVYSGAHTHNPAADGEAAAGQSTSVHRAASYQRPPHSQDFTAFLFHSQFLSESLAHLTYSADFQKCPGWERRRLRLGSFSSSSTSLEKLGLSSCSCAQQNRRMSWKRAERYRTLKQWRKEGQTLLQNCKEMPQKCIINVNNHCSFSMRLCRKTTYKHVLIT